MVGISILTVYMYNITQPILAVVHVVALTYRYAMYRLVPKNYSLVSRPIPSFSVCIEKLGMGLGTKLLKLYVVLCS